MRIVILFVFVFFLVSNAQTQNYLRFLNKYDMEVADTSKTDFKYFELVQGQGSVVLIHRFLKDSTKIFEKTVLFDSLGNQTGMSKRDFFESKQIKSIERVDNLVGENLTKKFYRNGVLKSEVFLRDGEVVSEKYYDSEGGEMSKVESGSPSPKDGMEGWNRYISTQLTYPIEARRSGYQGMVIVVFTLSKEGFIDDPQVFNHGENHESLEKEALKIFKEYPHRWEPAMEDGVPVETVVRMPVRFKLS
jgi:TonB family protein